MVTIIRYVFNEEMRDNLTSSVESIKLTFSNLESTTRSIDTLVASEEKIIADIIANIQSVTRTLKDKRGDIDNIISNLSTVSDTLASAEISKTLNAANNTLTDMSDLLHRIEEGEGNLGLLLKDDSLYNSLNKSISELSLLLEDIKLNPDRYIHVSVFGKSGKKNPYVPPEEREQDEKDSKKKKKNR
jgi:phospholipid/cholesterol/gamma-HCH transport system substrate-binding protein